MVEFPPASGPTSSPPRRLSRPKRCSCSSLRDKECIYFCHLDIIWINTPEQVVPYGLGGIPRTRRSTNNKLVELMETRARCECGNAEDDACQLFCDQDQEATRFQIQTQTEKHSPELKSDRTEQNALDCTHQRLNCVYQHLLNITKTLKRGSKEHLPAPWKNWMDRIRSRRRQDVVKGRSLGLRVDGQAPRCKERPC